MIKQSLTKLSRHWRKNFNTLCLLFSFAILLAGTTPVKAQSFQNIVGFDQNGKITSLRRSFKNRKTLINFWWVKCSPCKQELPDLLAKEKKHPQADFIYVHAETNPATKAAYKPQVVQQFLDQLNITLPQMIIGNTKARLSAGVEALPTTLLVSPEGKVDQTLVGFTPANTAAIEQWLAQ
jgi:thiol-disulfide isomerase/thioredoxin